MTKVDRVGNPKTRCVTRIDKRGTHGYQARVYRNHKTVYTKMFSDGRFDGDAEAAYIAAIADQRQAEKRFPGGGKWDRGIRRFYLRPARRSKTGITGVHLTQYSGRFGKSRPVAVATWTDADGDPKMQRFFWDEFGGRAGALAEAKLYRQEMVADTIRTLKARGVKIVLID